jgi:hypothetical protein
LAALADLHPGVGVDADQLAFASRLVAAAPEAAADLAAFSPAPRTRRRERRPHRRGVNHGDRLRDPRRRLSSPDHRHREPPAC